MPSFTEFPQQRFVKPSRDSSNNFDFELVDDSLARDYTQGNIIQPVRVITTAGQSSQQVKVTNGTNILNVNADGSINVAGSGTAVKAQWVNTNNTTRTDTYTVPVGKKWLVRRSYYFRVNTANVSEVLTISGTDYYISGTTPVANQGVSQMQEITLKAGDSWKFIFASASSGNLQSSIVYEESDE